jgi:1,4-alpha-glucan branching enzyme
MASTKAQASLIAPHDAQLLIAGRHPDPFAVLGLHRTQQGFVLRAMLPGARQVRALHAHDHSLLVTLEKLNPAGLFAAALPLAAAPAYRLEVQFADAQTQFLADAYSFGSLLDDAELRALSTGQHPAPEMLLGAHAMQLAGVDGVRFALWAPNAARVSVVGSFNVWDGRRHPMRLRHTAGVWEIFIPHVGPGDLYKFELLNQLGALLPLKADPYARRAELRPNTASIVSGLPSMASRDARRVAANQREAPIAIYEVHLGSWRHGAEGKCLDWDALAASLPAYVAGLGFSHVELMPISEFPFDGSWGYQTLGLFAPSARFTRFVAACHAAGLGVLLDWVPAHFPADAHGLAQFDGSHLYEYADPREGFHRDWNTLIYNFSRVEVRQFLAASAAYWVERFGVDGLRVDAVASMLYRDYSRQAGDWVPNHLGGRENLEAISLFQAINRRIGAIPGAMMVAEESTAFPGVTAPTDAGGLGFHFKWNMGWMNDTLRYMAEDPVHRRWHHDKISFGLVYAFSENYVLAISHDEVVHGKGSMLQKMPGDDWQRFANLRLYYGFMWGHPGKKLLFMGQEFAQPYEWQHESALPWQLLQQPQHAGVHALVRDLNALYRQHSALHQLDCMAAGFRWLVLNDRDSSVFAWLRQDRAGKRVVVLCHFTPLVRADYCIPLPDDVRALRELLNTDSEHYGGSNVGNGAAELPAFTHHSDGFQRAVSVRVPPLACVFFEVL